jgi:hypothetical protein
MYLNEEISPERSRSELFGPLLSCIFSDEAKNECPLSLLRKNLTVEEKYDYTVKLSDEEIFSVLKKHGECFQKRLFAAT